LTYTAAELRALAGDDRPPPPRSVRKTLFTFHLWRPARHRQPAVTDDEYTHHGERPPVRETGRSADRALSVGWLNAQSVRNKTDAVSELIDDRCLDVLALSETWHTDGDDVCLRLATPPGYAVAEVARSPGRVGGGVAVIYRQHFKCCRVALPASSTFESICVRLMSARNQVVILNIYRPGSEKPSAAFFAELSAVLETLVIYACPVVVGGDFNVRYQSADDPDTRRLGDVLSSFDMVQHVTGATHRCGNTLDLVMTFADCQLDAITVDPAGIVSDHALVVCRLPFNRDTPTTAERLVRGWRRVDRDELRHLLEASPLCQPVPDDADVDQLFTDYDAVLRDIADKLAPLHAVRRRPGRPTPWIDAECRAERRRCRRLERRYRRTRRDGDRRLWVQAARRRLRLNREKREHYWLDRLNQCGHSSSQLWRSLSPLLGRDRDVTGATGHTAEDFADYFDKKISDVRSATAGQSPPLSTSTAAPPTLASFKPCTQTEVRRIIMQSPVKSCTLDPVPTFLLREFVDLLLPYVTTMVNESLMAGRLPDSHKHAIITPLLKKPGLDSTDVANFRPVSNVSFLSKIVERAVAIQLNAHLSANGLLPRYQSAYRKKHSTETAMLRVWSDFLTSADVREVTLLGLLDMSAAFDCVDHDILLQRLEVVFSLTDTVLHWMRSFVTGRTQQVAYCGRLSPLQRLLFGVPQGSVLGPLLYVLYTAELEQVVARHGLRLHMYADDCQVYLSTSVEDACLAVDKFTACVADVDAWLSANRLRLNASKTQLMWLGSSQLVEKIACKDVVVLGARVAVSDTTRDLGVVIDRDLSLAAHVTAVCRSGYYQLRQLRPVVRPLSVHATKTLVQAFISCRLDYCNSLLYGIGDGLLRRLQSVQNAAARLVTGARRCDHITPVLRQLHWLPVRQRIAFKVAGFVHQSLAGVSPAYLVDDIRLLSDVSRRPSLRSNSNEMRKLVVPRTHNNLGDRSFSVAGPRLWNDLPPGLRRPGLSFASFRQSMKTHLFGDRSA